MLEAGTEIYVLVRRLLSRSWREAWHVEARTVVFCGTHKVLARRDTAPGAASSYEIDEVYTVRELAEGVARAMNAAAA